MSETKRQSYLRGAAILAATAIVAKIISGLYKIPLFGMLDDNTAGYYQVAYNVYSFLYAVSTAGIPVALSRLVAAASAVGDNRLVKRYFGVSLPAFTALGLILMLLVFFRAGDIAALLQSASAAAGIRILAPAVFFGCVIAVYRGYMQGHSQMVPTAVSQIIEVVCKAVFGLLIAWYMISQGFDKPLVSAGAIAGVSIGLGLGIPVLIWFKRRLDSRLRLDARPRGGAEVGPLHALLRVFKVSIPITLSSVFISLMTNIDTAIVNYRLVNGAGFDKPSAEALYGSYAKGLSLLNLSSALIVPITVSIIPAIAAAIASKNRAEADEITESSMKLVNIIAMPAGVGLCVLSSPIFDFLYPGSNPVAPKLLAIFGIASYFVCMQLLTTAILQANGHEKVPMLSYLAGGLAQIAVDWYLVGQPSVNIVGSPVGTLVCYLTITLINLLFIVWKVGARLRFTRIFIKPAFCTAVMGVFAGAAYELLLRAGSLRIGTGRMAIGLYLFASIFAAILVYGVLTIATRTVTREDMKLVPKGEKLVKLLKIK